METITKKYQVYKYNELEQSAKDKAFEKWQESQTEWFWIDEAVDSLKAFSRHFDVDLKDYAVGGVCQQRNFVEFSISDEMENLEYVRLWKYIKNNNYEIVYRHTKQQTNIYSGCPFTGMCIDDTLLDEILDFLKKPYKINYYDLIDSCFDKWLKWCQDEMDYQISEECFLEYAAIENQYLEDGTVFYS